MIGFFIERLSVKLGRIPQAEIDREAQALVAAHGVRAEVIARSHRERGAWVKGVSDIPERTKRVHKAVLRLKRQAPP